MPRNTVYLEAPDRTQDLLNIQVDLAIRWLHHRLNWHEAKVNTPPPTFQDHWNATAVQQLQFCDSLVVICRNIDRTASEMAMIAGFALGRGLRVIWIGPPVRGLADVRAVQQFNTAEAFRTQILQQTYSQSISTGQRVAA